MKTIVYNRVKISLEQYNLITGACDLFGYDSELESMSLKELIDYLTSEQLKELKEYIGV